MEVLCRIVLQQSTSIGHCSSFRSSIHDMKTPTAHAVAFSVFFTTMGFLLASTSASETATKRCGWQTLPRLVLWHVFEVGVTLEIVSGVLQWPR